MNYLKKYESFEDSDYYLDLIKDLFIEYVDKYDLEFVDFSKNTLDRENMRGKYWGFLTKKNDNILGSDIIIFVHSIGYHWSDSENSQEIVNKNRDMKNEIKKILYDVYSNFTKRIIKNGFKVKIDDMIRVAARGTETDQVDLFTINIKFPK